MNNSNDKKIEYFIALCDDLISCKFLVAESKIQKLLAALAETEPIYQLVSECMEQFNHDREMNKAFVTDGKGRFYVLMPNEEYKTVALVFCTLADIERKSIDFTDFIKRYFDDEEGVNCYTNFARKMIVPFRELVAEAFGYPKRYLREEESEEAPDAESLDGDESLTENVSVEQKFLKNCQSIAQDMLVEIDEYEKAYDRRVQELKAVLTQLALAAREGDADRAYALAIGARYASKGLKSVKFLLRELAFEIDEYVEGREE